MGSRELCPSCKPYKKCLFKAYANIIAKSVPPERKQIFIEPGLKVGKETLAAQELIASLRIQAEKSGCPYTYWNPNYHGKKNL